MGILAVLTLFAQSVVPQAPPPPAAPPPPPMPVVRPAAVCEAYWNSGAIFSGEVVGVAQSAPAPAVQRGGPRYPFSRELTVRVDRSWRGDAHGEVAVFVGPELAKSAFERGGKYLFYTAPFAEHFRVHGGSRTKPLNEAAEDLEYFERAERTSGGATITGRIAVDEEAGASAASGYTVRLATLDREWTARSDASGVFEFTALPAGHYGIRVEVPDGLRVKGPSTISIRDPRACARPHFTIRAEGAVELFVLDRAGKPAVRTTLELIDVESLPDREPRVLTSRTYADGSAGWGGVPAGRRYVVGLNVTRVPDPKRPQPILFYPGVADLAAAHVFEVGVGERVQLETLRLPDPPARLAVTGVVLRPDGMPFRGVDVVLKSAARLSHGRPVGSRVRTDAQGRFSLPAVAGYRYFVEASLSIDGEPPRDYAVSEAFLLDARTQPLRITRRR